MRPEMTTGERLYVVETRLEDLEDRVRGLTRALWATVGSIIVAVVIFLLTLLTHVIGGPH